MAETWEYKTLRVDHIRGKGYDSPDDGLNTLGAEGWEIFHVFHDDAKYKNEMFEIFYLKRKTTKPTML